MKHIFVSYARRDTERVDRIVETLRGAGYSVWIDRGGILAARLWRKEIVVAIRESTAFVLALSPYSVASENVRKELDLSQQYHKHIVPLFLAETTIPDEMQYQLVGVQQVDWRSFDEDFEGGFEELCRTLGSLGMERLDVSTEAAPSSPASGWRAAPGVFGIVAVLGALIVYAMARLTQSQTGIPSSLTSLMPASPFDSGGMGRFGLGLAGILATLGILYGYARSLRPTIARLAPFFLLTVPLAIWTGQRVAASLGVLTAVAIGAWWRWKPNSGAARASALAHALILLGSVVLGVTTQDLLARASGGGSNIGVTPFEIADDEDLERKQADLSNRLSQKLSAVFSLAGWHVVPQRFNEKNLGDWSIDNWRAEKGREVEPRLLLRTSLTRCGVPVRPGGAGPASYTWLAEPYGRDLKPLPDFVSASGSDSRVLSLRIAFELLTATPGSIDLGGEQRNAALKMIVQDALTVARSSGGRAEQIETATALLAQRVIDVKKLRELLAGLTANDRACDEAATRNRQAQTANASSYSEEGP